MKFLIRALFAVLCMAIAAAVAAEDYPARPIRMVVPYAAGGLPDTIARLIGQRLADALGQQVIVENRGGAGGIAGTEQVAKAAPDGYTLLVADVGQLAINPHLYSKLPYDPVKDLVAVSLAGTAPLFLVVHPSVPAANFTELIALARAKPGALTYGSSGTGSIHHLSMEALKSAFGLDIVHVPYKGTGQSVPALLGGQVSMLFSAGPSLVSHLKTGGVRVLAVNTAKRSAQAPDVPAIAEFGVADYDYPAEIGVLAPAGTPAAIVSKLSAEIARAVKHTETAQRFAQLGIDPVGSTAEAYAAQNRLAYERYARVVRIAGAKLD